MIHSDDGCLVGLLYAYDEYWILIGYGDWDPRVRAFMEVTFPGLTIKPYAIRSHIVFLNDEHVCLLALAAEMPS